LDISLAEAAVIETRAAAARRLGAADPTPSIEMDSGSTPEEASICEGTGRVEVSVDDDWTYVWVNGRQETDPTKPGKPLILSTGQRHDLELPAGEHEIRLAHDFRKTQIRTLRLCGGDAPTQIRAKRRFLDHRVTFSGFPDGSRVLVNDEPSGSTAEGVALAAGDGYRVTVVHLGEELASRFLKVGIEAKDALPGRETQMKP
jgi:hypothetical protein